jgi:hypothetical protein
MRVLVTGIPSYLTRTVESASGVVVKHRPFFEDIRTKQDLIRQAKIIANTGNYLIGEGAAHSVQHHNTTYIPFWHLVNNIDSNEVYEQLNNSFDIVVFASANLLRPGYSADLEARVFERLHIPVVIMGIGIQRKGKLKDELPGGTLRFLEILKSRQSYFLTRGHYTAAFLQDYGMKFVRPTGCPSLYFSPTGVKQSLTRLADPELADSSQIAFSGYLGSVPDTIVDAHALVRPESTVSYVLQDEIVAYNLNIVSENDTRVYDQEACRIIAPTEYKHSEIWQRRCELMVFFDTNRWRTWVSGRHFCFGRRFHGCVIGMQAGIPSLMITVDDRMREMLELVGFPTIEASIWNPQEKKKDYLKQFLARIDVAKALDRYAECEANFRGALKEIGLSGI